MTFARAIVVAVLLGALASPGPSTAAPLPKYPNLVTLPPDDLRFDTVDGVGKVLRFANTVHNKGAGPLHLVPEHSGTTTTVWQEVYDHTTAQGSPAERHNVGTADYHPGHGHWHINDFVGYELYTRADWDGRTGQKRGAGKKTSFCIVDSVRVFGNLSAAYTNCGATLPYGITVGWADVYLNGVADQWIALGAEGLADGDYVLRSVADPLNRIYESANKTGAAESDNDGLTPFAVCGGAIKAGTCSTAQPPPNDNLLSAFDIPPRVVPFSVTQDTTGATTEFEESLPRCGTAVGRTVWFRIQVPATGTLVVSTDGSNFDTVVALKDRARSGGQRELACDDDGGAGPTSLIRKRFEGGTFMLVQVGGNNNAGGSLTLRLSME
jgi:hypothetical protein